MSTIKVNNIEDVKTLTIGDATAEDTKIVFDGNAQDFHIGLDDSSDSLTIGLGSTLGTTSHMVFDANGHITKPLQPAFLARPSGTQSDIAIDATTTVVFDTEVYDNNGDFSSNTFTAPVTGKYLLNAEVRIDNLDLNTTYYGINISASNRGVSNFESTNQFDTDPAYYHKGLTVVMDMDANDTASITIEIANNGAAQADIRQWSHFSGYLLG